MAGKNFKELLTWQRAMDLVEAVYLATKTFPKDELYGLTSQKRRAAISIPSNIAEGQGRDHTKEFVHFLSVAYGSLSELETQIPIAARISYVTAQDSEKLLGLVGEVGRLLNGLSKSLNR
jgi:four helix bundle protein